MYKDKGYLVHNGSHQYIRSIVNDKLMVRTSFVFIYFNLFLETKIQTHEKYFNFRCLN
jgi:hypothetical protein